MNEIALETVARDLAYVAPNDFEDTAITNMSEDAWLLWSRAAYDYGDNVVPTVVIKAYVEEIEEGDNYL